MSGPSLQAVRIADPPERWQELGFAVSEGVTEIGGVRLELGAHGRGIMGWAVDGVDAEIDGLPLFEASPAASGGPGHPNGAIGIDHVVIASPDFDRTSAALAAAGMELRRERDGGGFRQGFRRIGPAILELVEARGAEPGPARFWGLVVTVEDLDQLAASLGEQLGKIHDAVQSGRRIATLRREAGLSVRVAFMTPEPS